LPSDSPVRPIRIIVQDSDDPGYTNRLLVGTACTGLLRVEWVAARYGQLIPLNWSMTAQMQAISSTVDYMPLRYLVSDAQNLIVAEAIRLDMEWVLLLEHDVVMPPDMFMRLNHYMREARTPVVSGLYFSRAYPSEPMVFRGMGQGSYLDWKLGDKVWCDGVPTGALLIHMGLIRTMWADSEPYTIGGIATCRVFDTPRYSWVNPETGMTNMSTGTSDLEWCQRVIRGDYLRKAGWGAFADEHGEYPFLCDTGLFCKHINPSGETFPDKASLAYFEG
jgi:hypothetical protein